MSRSNNWLGRWLIVECFFAPPVNDVRLWVVTHINGQDLVEGVNGQRCLFERHVVYVLVRVCMCAWVCVRVLLTWLPWGRPPCQTLAFHRWPLRTDIVPLSASIASWKKNTYTHKHINSRQITRVSGSNTDWHKKARWSQSHPIHGPQHQYYIVFIHELICLFAMHHP